MKRSASVSSVSSAAGGEITDKLFFEAFANTQPEKLANSKALTNRLQEINGYLVDPKNDWSKKVKILGELRGCLVSTVPNSVEIVYENAELWKKCLVDGLKELRSTLTREYCITVAFFAIKLRRRFLPQVELLFSNLMSLVKSSIKIISSSAIVLSEFIAKYVKNVNLVILFNEHLSSKSYPVRVNVVHMLCIILSSWESDLLIRLISSIKKVIITGLTDANVTCRSTSQSAYNAFYKRFPHQALELYDSLDAARQKALDHKPSAALCSAPVVPRQKSNISFIKAKASTSQLNCSINSSIGNGSKAPSNDNGITRRISSSKNTPIKALPIRSAETPSSSKATTLYRGNSLPGMNDHLSKPLHGKSLARPNHMAAPPPQRQTRPSLSGSARSSSLPRSNSEYSLGAYQPRAAETRGSTPEIRRFGRTISKEYS